jgi:hypothetical protein
MTLKIISLKVNKNNMIIINYPLSRFPQGGKASNAPSPVGEGWEGGNAF